MSERVDLDRLADYVGGALDGTPEADTVRRLIATDAAWEAAYTDLVTADAAVRADLAACAADEPGIPDDVAGRLALLFTGPPARVDGAADPHDGSPVSHAGHDGSPASRAGHDGSPLSHAGHAGGPARDGASGSRAARDGEPLWRVGREPGRRPGRGTRADGAPGGARPGGSGPGRARSRRIYAGVSAAAAVLLVAVGLLIAVPKINRERTGSGDTAAGAAAPHNAVAPEAAGVPQQLATGTDYRRGQFGALLGGDRAAGADKRSEADAFGEQPPAGAPFRSGSPVAPASGELGRLLSTGARDACLDTIRAVYRGVVRVVDYARYEGRPALVTLLDGVPEAAGRPWVVVVGADCGLRPGERDERWAGPIA